MRTLKMKRATWNLCNLNRICVWHALQVRVTMICYSLANTSRDSSHRWTGLHQPFALLLVFIIHLSRFQHPGYERPRSPSPWSHLRTTGVPQRPRGPQPPTSPVQLKNILRDVKLHHPEAEPLARFHRNFAATSDSWVSVYYFYQKYSSSSNPLLYLWHPQPFTAREARLLRRPTSFIIRHTISNAECSDKLFGSQQVTQRSWKEDM